MKHRMPKRSWASGRGALTVIALILISSALIRFSGSGAAIALELKDQMEGSDDEVAMVDDQDVKDLTPDLLNLLAATKEREARVLAREAELEARLQALELIEAAVTDDLARLEQAEAKLLATMSQADKAAEDDIGQLTSVYENMKPEQAAALFQMMEPSFAAGFLARMRSDVAAAILAGLEPDMAYSISVVLAGRNANVPREPIPEAME